MIEGLTLPIIILILGLTIILIGLILKLRGKSPTLVIIGAILLILGISYYFYLELKPIEEQKQEEQTISDSYIPYSEDMKIGELRYTDYWIHDLLGEEGSGFYLVEIQVGETLYLKRATVIITQDPKLLGLYIEIEKTDDEYLPMGYLFIEEPEN